MSTARTIGMVTHSSGDCTAPPNTAIAAPKPEAVQRVEMAFAVADLAQLVTAAIACGVKHVQFARTPGYHVDVTRIREWVFEARRQGADTVHVHAQLSALGQWLLV